MFYFPSRGVYKTRVDDTRAAYETKRYVKEEHHPEFLVSTAELEQLSLLLHGKSSRNILLKSIRIKYFGFS